MTKCYICNKETIEAEILVQEGEAIEDSIMYHNDYHPIPICPECFKPIQEHIDIEEKNRLQRNKDFIKRHSIEAAIIAQSWFDSMGTSGGLVVRDIMSDVTG